MAPKGGGGRGGGGGGGRGGSSSISCDGPGFATTHSKVLIAFAAIFFVTYLVLSCIIPGRKKRTILNNGQPPAGKAKWLFLRLSILTAFLSMLLFLASFTMTQCGSGSTETVNGVKIAELWFEEFSLITIFGVILIPLCKNLHDVSGNLVPKLVALGHSVYFVFLALLDLISVIILTAFYEVMRTGSSRDRDTVLALHTASKGVTAAFNVFALLGMGLAAVSMLLAVLRSSALKQGKLVMWVFVLIGSSIGLTLVVFAIHIHVSVLNNRLKAEADIAYFVLRSLLYAIMFTAVLYIMKNPVLVSGGTVPTAAPIFVTPQQQPLMGYTEGPNKNLGYNPQVNTAYSPQYQPSPSPVPQSSPSPAYNAPYNGNNVSYAPVAAAPPPQGSYYH